ncbi:uncharacterized protein [Cicer arietinum]|uniref:Uncharacterized protein LOC101498414 n=1 Tax=Cicer arietinum TaxID=3827 RepID=A0A1S2YA54_CICAR|nr:uncharacterized protein LOC101498414 [Cicer arietinum]
MTKVADNLCQLPWDVLDIISRKLDFDDLFQFSGVCKNWWEFHKTYWRDFLVSQEPLIVRNSYYIRKCYTFISIPHQKVYHSKKMNDLKNFLYFGSSSGYLIMTENNHSFVLMNPFIRKVILIDTSSTFKVELSDFAYYVLLAFGKGSDEFVFVALCKSSHSLHIYQSQNFGWVTYSPKRNSWKGVDFTILHNAIYVVTDQAKIGVFSLNSEYIEFLKLKSTLKVTSSSYVRLIDCVGQLLVLNIISNEILNVYKIDFSTMNCVKLETLGDIALFYAPKEKYYALSSSEKWGYRRNSVYVIDLPSKKCKVYIGDDNELPKFIIRPIYNNTQTYYPPYLLDWCFRHQLEVDLRNTMSGESPQMVRASSKTKAQEEGINSVEHNFEIKEGKGQRNKRINTKLNGYIIN